MVKIAWGITGCGDKIEEIAALHGRAQEEA